MNKIIATPLARALAAKQGIDLSSVSGSGPNGRILISDVENFKPQSASAPIQKAASIPEKSEQAAKAASLGQIHSLQAHTQKIAPIRKAIARAMKNSWAQVAYVNLVNEIEMTNLWDMRKSMVDDVLKLTGIKLTFLPFIIKALAIALKEFPVLAAKYNETTEELIFPGQINMGVAVDTEAGLMVPVIKNAEQLTILEISQEVARLAAAARNKTIKAAEMQGADFTITNYGSVGSLYGVPVINWPELAIAGVGAIIDRAVVKNGAVVPGKVMHLTVAADHRWADGATIGRFASRVKDLLEKPQILGVF
ncbi:2-oxo acid dehydrogenase subunit E2 [Mycoplasma iguanae]|uniref:2-oxo acid dehydrogenase subunit E2 n=1 Tax=Mycoplasma iguanae TaxID=292461 RepID=A0ABY5RA66_9MOLU|nr:2-oxo acid dehydrogenase subunit E2 [Mycoplasma iguanae]UVD81510.1 2-oxo acid dehydrogenase subunit E2 [Mycoplasma iguanae]